LHYNYLRYADPDTGQYLQADPIGLGGGLNSYVYALANPVTFTDRLGLQACGGADCPPKSLSESEKTSCCDSVRAQILNRSPGQPLSGFVACCRGLKHICVTRVSDPQPLKGILEGCTEEHERDHYEDPNYVCPADPNCKQFYSGTFLSDPDWFRGECSGYGRGIGCLAGALAKCGSNTTCRKRVKVRAENLRLSANASFKCNLVLPAVLKLRPDEL
jgi:hypothetical protein